jgi:hypothetical protein
MKHLVRVIRWAGVLLVLLIAIVAIAWAFGAVWFDAPFRNGQTGWRLVLLAMTFVVVLLFVRRFRRKLLTFLVLFACVARLVADAFSDQR